MLKNIFEKISIKQILLLFVYVLIFACVLFFNQYYVTNAADDTYDVATFRYVYHGKYIAYALLNIAYGLVPSSFENIHINTWGQTGGAVVYSIFLIILISTLSSLFFIKNKKNYLYPIVILFNFIIFYFVFSLNHEQFYYYIYSKTFFFHCLIGYIFFFLFIDKLLKIILSEISCRKKDMFELSLYAFLMGLSGDIISIFALLFFGVLVCFKRKFENISIVNILTVLGTLLFSLCISFSSLHFKRCFLIGKFFEEMSSLGDRFIKFNDLLIWVFENEFLILSLIILFLSVLLCLYAKKYSKKYNLINIILLITIVFFVYSVFIIDRGYFSITFIVHRDMWFQTKLFLLMIINIETGFLLIEIKNNKKLWIIISIFLICMSSKYVISEMNYIGNVGIKTYIKAKTHIEEIKENYHNRYILERILLWYLYSDKAPIILKNNSYFYFYEGDSKDSSDAWASAIKWYFYFQKHFNYVKYNHKDIKYLDTLEEVVEKYYENGGGEITEDEIEKADFNKLLDEDWVTK